MTTKTVFQLNAAGVLIGEAQADESPLEPGIYHLPAGCVEQDPPPPRDGQIRVFADGGWRYVPEPVTEFVPIIEPTAEEISAAKIMAAEQAIQAHLDAKAQAEGFDNILTAVSYAATPAGTPFQAEGKSFAVWRAKVWSKAYEILGAAQTNKGDETTIEQIIAELPSRASP